MSVFVYVVGGWLALMLAAERLAPWSGRLAALARSERWRRLVKNAAIAGLNFAAAPVLVTGITLYAADHALDWRPAWLTGGVALALDLVVLDLWIYAWHRAVHAMPMTWQLHQVHHMDEAVDVTSAFRFHAGDVLISTLSRAAVVLAMGIPLRHVVLFEVATIVASAFHHANLRLPPGLSRALGWVIVTPAIHGLHHHPERALHDTNYGTILSIWDRLLGSLCRQERTPETPAGVAGRPDEGFVGLLVRPFHEGAGRR